MPNSTSSTTVNLNYLLEYSEHERKEGLMLLDLNDENEDVTTINSYEENYKSILYNQSSFEYWLEVIRYSIVGKRELNFDGGVYPLHFRKNVKRVKRIFYGLFLGCCLIILLYGSLMFFVYKYSQKNNITSTHFPSEITPLENPITTYNTPTSTPTSTHIFSIPPSNPVIRPPKKIIISLPPKKPLFR